MNSHRTKGVVKSEVYVNVYDIVNYNDYLYNIGFGLFHSGVEINGVEYSYGEGSGICMSEPKDVNGATFRESIYMGDTDMDSAVIQKTVDRLRLVYDGDSYHFLTKNCNCFSNAFCKSLLNKEIPAYINRCAYLASFFSCLFPSNLDPGVEVINPPSRFVGRGNSIEPMEASGPSGDEQSREYQREMRLKVFRK